MTIREMHKRLDEIGWEMIAVEYKAQTDYEAKKTLRKLMQEKLMLENKLNDFYIDPMTEMAGF